MVWINLVDVVMIDSIIDGLGKSFSIFGRFHCVFWLNNVFNCREEFVDRRRDDRGMDRRDHRSREKGGEYNRFNEKDRRDRGGGDREHGGESRHRYKGLSSKLAFVWSQSMF